MDNKKYKYNDRKKYQAICPWAGPKSREALHAGLLRAQTPSGYPRIKIPRGFKLFDITGGLALKDTTSNRGRVFENKENYGLRFSIPTQVAT